MREMDDEDEVLVDVLDEMPSTVASDGLPVVSNLADWLVNPFRSSDN